MPNPPTPTVADIEGLRELAERCEKATGPDRELDARIAVTIYSDGGHPDPRDNTSARFPSRSDECASGTYWISAFSGLSLRTAPAYTASLDAAMTLVPEGYVAAIVNSTLSKPEAAERGTAFVGLPSGDKTEPTEAATPAVALTAACLRARAFELEQHRAMAKGGE